LGSQSGILVSTWAVDYPETTEEAIQVAREFLLHPDTLAKELALRLFPSTGEE
jgi:homoserine acetyltransferase